MDYFKKDILSFKFLCDIDNRIGSIDPAIKLFVLQVYTGIKQAGMLEGFQKVETDKVSRILYFLKKLGIFYMSLPMDKNIKILFSRRKDTLSKLLHLHNRIFLPKCQAHETTISLLDARLGVLLGYPTCCAKRFAKTETHSCLLAYRSSYVKIARVKNRWILPYQLNYMADIPLIFHTPCSLSCKASFSKASKILSIYEQYDPILSNQIKTSLKKPIIVFAYGHFIRLDGYIKGHEIFYKNSTYVNPSCLETGQTRPCDNDIHIIAKYVKEGNMLRYSSRGINIFKDKTLIFKHGYSENRLQILDFI